MEAHEAGSSHLLPGGVPSCGPHHAVQLILQLLVDPLQGCIVALDPEQPRSVGLQEREAVSGTWAPSLLCLQNGFQIPLERQVGEPWKKGKVGCSQATEP